MKVDKNRLIFGAFLLVVVAISFLILGHFKIPGWPAFLVMICFFETHMDKKKIPNILVGGLFGLANLLMIKYFIQFLAPHMGVELCVLLYMLIFIFLIIGLGETLPILLNNYAFLFFTVVGLVYTLPNFNLFLLMGVEIIGGGIFIAAILGIIKIVTIMAIKRATKAAAAAVPHDRRMKVKIKAAVIREKAGPFIIEELDLDEPRPDEILVRVVASGICHTDVTLRDNPLTLPIVLGHEGAGIVEKVGNRVTKVKPGDAVVLSYVYCGHCANCQEGLPAYCTQSVMGTFGGVRADGTTTLSKNGEKIHGNFFGQSSLATYALTYEHNAVLVRSDAPLEMLGPLGCGIQTGAGAVINSLRVKVGSTIAIFGLGSVGLSAVMAAKVAGCSKIIGVDVKPGRLELAYALGATHVLDASAVNPVSEIKKMTGDGANYSLECAGNPKVFRQALESVRRPGVCGLMGGAPMGTEVTFDMNSIMFGRTVRGILEGDSVPDIFIPQLVELIMQGRFPLQRLVTYYDLDDINQAVADSEEGRTIKPIIRMPV